MTAVNVNVPFESDSVRETSRLPRSSVTAAPASGVSWPSTTEPLIVVFERACVLGKAPNEEMRRAKRTTDSHRDIATSNVL